MDGLQDVRRHMIVRRKWLMAAVWLKTLWNIHHLRQQLSMHRRHLQNPSVLFCVFVS